MKEGKGETIALKQGITEKIDTGNIGNLTLKRPVGKKIQCLKSLFHILAEEKVPPVTIWKI